METNDRLKVMIFKLWNIYDFLFYNLYLLSFCVKNNQLYFKLMVLMVSSSLKNIKMQKK